MTEIEKAITAFEAVQDDEENPILTFGTLKFYAVAEPACKEALAALREKRERSVNLPLTLERFEAICEAVHNGWWKEKINQGVTGHPDMIPYADLAENIKDYDRVTVCRVLDALGIAYRRPPEGDEE